VLTRVDDRLANRRWGFASKRLVTALELRLLLYYKRNALERAGLDVVREIYAHQPSFLAVLFRGATPVLFSPGELLTLYHQARIMRDHGGAFAEVGAFRGDSAEVVCRVKGDRPFYVFEAFDGLPVVGGADSRFARGMFASSEAALRKRLERHANTTVVAGYFPATAAPVLNATFSYVHLDIDLYEPTKQALAFFYPRVRPGGRIIAHDYSQCEGVRRAFDEFFADKAEYLEPTGVSQVLVVKRA
jgi:O-methyltransferase